MNERQRRFVDEYLIDLNAGKAAVRAGYSEKSSGSSGSLLLKKPAIREAVSERLAQLESGRVMAVREVMERLSAIARGDGADSDPPKKPTVREALSALELLGKRYGIFSDRADISQGVTVIIEDDYGD